MNTKIEAVFEEHAREEPLLGITAHEELRFLSLKGNAATHRHTRKAVGSTCVITVGKARNRNADSLTGTQLTLSSASRSPTGQRQLPLDRGLRRHK